MFREEKNVGDGVSPVVGVMLMLVVTIIIAAVVSAFAGGLSSGEQKAPSISADVQISNGGVWGNSCWRMNVLSVDEPIPTEDLKIVNTWKANGVSRSITVTGPNTYVDFVDYGDYQAQGNTHYMSSTKTTPTDYMSPLGFGPGVANSVGASYQGPGGQYYTDQHWGNYTLTGGTIVYANPMSTYGYWVDKPFTYDPESFYGATYNLEIDVDPMQAVLGMDWEDLRSGDVVNVKLVHIPSGKVIYEKDVTVQETG